jgi:hypothetical protein
MSATRSNGKPNSTRRVAIRESLSDTCGTCDLEMDWSALVDEKAAHKGTFGHVVAEEVGGTWEAGNIFGQCWGCNWSAKCAGITDLSAYVRPGSIPAKYLPTKSVTTDRRDLPAKRFDRLGDALVTDKRARRAARIARGGWH